MKNEDLREYQTLGMPLLKLMGLLALIGIAVTLALHYIVA